MKDKKSASLKSTTEDSSKEQLRRQFTTNGCSTRSNRKLYKQLLSTKGKDSVSLIKSHLKVTDKDLKGIDQSKRTSVDKSVAEFSVHPEENYQLTERVLQWLDLAGKTSVSTEENTSESVTHNNKSSKRVFTANPSLGGGNSGGCPKKTILPLKRTESIHRLSLTLNEEELVNHPGSHPPNILHLSQLSGRKLRQMSSSKVKTAQVAANSQNTGTKLNVMSPKSTTSSSTAGSAGTSSGTNASGNKAPPKSLGNKKKSLCKLGKTESIENQYRSMIHRQLLETSCNTQLAKRQLHIFMPNPKLGGTTTATQSQNDCDSCLNSLISDVSK